MSQPAKNEPGAFLGEVGDLDEETTNKFEDGANRTDLQHHDRYHELEKQSGADQFPIHRAAV